MDNKLNCGHDKSSLVHKFSDDYCGECMLHDMNEYMKENEVEEADYLNPYYPYGTDQR